MPWEIRLGRRDKKSIARSFARARAPYDQQDHAVLSAAKDRNDLASSHLLWERSSAYKLELIVSALYQSKDIPQKPHRVIGCMRLCDGPLRKIAAVKAHRAC